MFTRNYYKYYAREHANNAPTASTIDLYIETDGTTGPSFYSSTSSKVKTNNPNYWKSAMGAVSQASIKQPVQNNSNAYTLGSGYAAVFGTGTTPPTVDDYTLAGDVVNGLTVSVSSSSQVDDDYMGAQCTKKYTITNNNENDITIGEIGLFVENVWQSQTTTGTSPKPYHHGYAMIERTVLDIPITIPAGGVGQVTYSIAVDFSTATAA